MSEVSASPYGTPALPEIPQDGYSPMFGGVLLGRGLAGFQSSSAEPGSVGIGQLYLLLEDVWRTLVGCRSS